MTPQQTIQRISNLVWNAGDRDWENAVKHIGYALRAIAQGKHWYEGLDYLLPGGPAQYDYENKGENRQAYVALIATVSACWSEIEALRDDLGTEDFAFILSEMARGYNDFSKDLVHSALYCTSWNSEDIILAACQ